jgi:uncharacterized integral membrane protein
VTDSELGSSGESDTEQTSTRAGTASGEESPPVAGGQPTQQARGRRRARSSSPDGAGVRHTRISGAWAAVAVTTVLGVALVDFIVENTHSVEIHFFSVAGRISVAAALLAAALAGAAVVLFIGVARTAQLRLSIRHHRRAHEADSAAALEDSSTASEPAPN